MNPSSARYVESVVNNASAWSAPSAGGGLTFNQTGFAVSKTVTFPLTATDLVIGGVVDGSQAFRRRWRAGHPPAWPPFCRGEHRHRYLPADRAAAGIRSPWPMAAPAPAALRWHR